MSAARYTEASDVASALAALAEGARPIAGGTDLVVGARHGKAPLPQSIVGIHRLPGLATIESVDGGGLRLGALVSHAALMSDPVVLQRFTGLADASAIVGSHATRANGTIGGNVMNASPAMDTGAPLLCHGGVAVLAGPDGERRVSLADLWTGPGRVSSAPTELLVAVELESVAAQPEPNALPGPPGLVVTGSAYVRLQYRRQMEIAIVGAAAVVTLSAQQAGARVVAARVAITALTPVIVRVPDAEAALIGSDGGAAAAGEAGRLAASASRPISDVRGSADYRRAMAAVITRRAITAAVERARGHTVPIPASDSTFASGEDE